MKKITILVFLIIVNAILWAAGVKEENKDQSQIIKITDSYGNDVSLRANPEYLICSGPGALRLAVYLQVEDRVIAVDDMEKSRKKFDARPYALAHPKIKELPLFGEFRGHDNPELILGLEPQPQVIFKTYPNSGYDPKELHQKTGIPVVTLNYGDLIDNKDALYKSLRLMAEILHCTERAEEVINYMEGLITDLEKRTKKVLEEDKKSCYIGGIAQKASKLIKPGMTYNYRFGNNGI